ncbi:hypothetical protein BJ508DRAFT_312403 [Ascobolus immersus RN42]|uniref:Uncharacterized protein n=1 Tax=Ascobolus immersus RN42 TaxID=1160509 RepID=A0A3N4HMC9_ASCIM|nr:hypothetical protein BJ508DRAFT_312403 [Ascobolus immersus RN42]
MELWRTSQGGDPQPFTTAQGGSQVRYLWPPILSSPSSPQSSGPVYEVALGSRPQLLYRTAHVNLLCTRLIHDPDGGSEELYAGTARWCLNESVGLREYVQHQLDRSHAAEKDLGMQFLLCPQCDHSFPCDDKRDSPQRTARYVMEVQKHQRETRCFIRNHQSSGITENSDVVPSKIAYDVALGYRIGWDAVIERQANEIAHPKVESPVGGASESRASSTPMEIPYTSELTLSGRNEVITESKVDLEELRDKETNEYTVTRANRPQALIRRAHEGLLCKRINHLGGWCLQEMDGLAEYVKHQTSATNHVDERGKGPFLVLCPQCDEELLPDALTEDSKEGISTLQRELYTKLKAHQLISGCFSLEHPELTNDCRYDRLRSILASSGTSERNKLVCV